MSTVIYLSTILLDISGVLFSFLFLWLNAFTDYSDLPTRNKNILKTSKTSMILSMIFALLTCLLSKSESIEESISKTATLYTIIAISWLVVLLACGIVLMYLSIIKRSFKADVSLALKQVFKNALPGAIIGLFMSWLFS
mgnify:CR=1 FL=1